MIEERTKLENIELKAKNTDTTKLVRFNDALYGKSYALIDYVGDINKSIGKIDYLIEKEYLPIINGETNCQEFYEANVIEVNNNSMILNVDNVAVLFNAIEMVYSSDTTLPYIPDGMNIANENEVNIPTDKEYNRDIKNVTIEVLKDTITNKSLEILITDNNEDCFGWGVDFKIQQKVNGEWKNLEYVSDDLAWNSIAYLPNEDKQIKQKIDIEKYYGKLDNGTYRVAKSVYDKGYIDIYSNEFEI